MTATTLTLGTRVGPFEILSSLGEGGMGAVYRARDTKLNRDVAIKVLLPAVANDPDRLARFSREAQVLASLNHPNIAAIYGLEGVGGSKALVLELVEGPTLADRMAKGAIPLDEALPIAKQIAEALEAAHEQGIIHRDLKPANIKVREDGTVKVLDFGLAKAMEPVSLSTASVSMSPTITTPAMTLAGMILGTAAYLSPEQAKGRVADKRCDVWAFGCVLYEMLAGRRCFAGEDVADTLAFVITKEPDWSALPADTPAPLRTLLRRCLEKDRRRRLRDIGDTLHELDEDLAPQRLASEPSQPAGKRGRSLGLAAAALVIACALTSVAAWRMKPVPQAAVTRFALTLPPDQQLAGGLGRMVAFSADGSHLAYAANNQLYARAMAEATAVPIAGTNAARVRSVLNFALSPDGQFVALMTDGALKKIPLTGGLATTICPVESATSLSWGRAGILFVGQDGIMRVSPDGGPTARVAAVAETELAHDPQMLPDGHTVLFTVAKRADDVVARWDRADVVVQSAPSGPRRTVIHGGSDARYVASGHLVYAVGGSLLAVPFDAARQQIIGTPVTVIDGVRRSPTTVTAQFSVSDSGTLVYLQGPPGPGVVERRSHLVILNVNGNEEALPVPEGPYEFPRFSPDGTRVAFDTDDGKNANVWVYEVSGTSAMRRLTFGGRNRHPVWSRDGQWITFQSDREGDLGLFRQRADGTGAAERLTKADQATAHVPQSWSPSGDRLLFTVNKGGTLGAWTGAQNPGSKSVLMLLSVKEHKTEPFGVESKDRAVNAEFSPNGELVAFSTGSDPTVAYVQPFPATGAMYQISKDDDGHHPWWSHDGLALFYVPGPDGLTQVRVSMRPNVSFGQPVALPRGELRESPVTSRNMDVAPDGRRIVGVAPAGPVNSSAANLSSIQVVLNWTEELKRLVTTK